MAATPESIKSDKSPTCTMFGVVDCLIPETSKPMLWWLTVIHPLRGDGP